MMTGVLITVLLLIAMTIFVLRGVYFRWGTAALVAGLLITGLGCLGLGGVMYCCDRTIMRAADGRCFDRAEDLPASQWGILFGTGRNRRANEYYDSRLAAAMELYQAGKISYVLVSGENLHKDYQEVDSMYQAMLAIGVPPERLVCDTAGRDTYSTLLHTRELADTARVILISQRFHNERALYYAEQMQVNAIAYNAAPNSVWYKRFRDYTREKLARVKAILKSKQSNSNGRYPDVEIRTNMYDSFNADSINNIFAEYDLPLYFTDYNLSICDKYQLCVDTVDWGETIEVISVMNSMYVIYVPEYIVGYDLWFFYDLKTNQLYQTGPMLEDDYVWLYATLDFSKPSISAQFYGDSIEKRVNLFMCETDTIRL